MPISRARSLGATGTSQFKPPTARKVAVFRAQGSGNVCRYWLVSEGEPIDWNGGCSLQGAAAIVAVDGWSLKAKSLIRS